MYHQSFPVNGQSLVYFYKQVLPDYITTTRGEIKIIITISLLASHSWYPIFTLIVSKTEQKHPTIYFGPDFVHTGNQYQL